MTDLNIDLENLKQDHWTPQELQNVKLVVGFMQTLMNDHKFEEALASYGNEKYTQHNRNIADGMPALINYVKGFVKRFSDYGYDVKRIHADGDYVIFHSHITTNKNHRGNDKKGINVSDTWRIENNEIAEHWDSLQPINGFMRFFVWLTGGKVANSNGVF